MTIFDGGFRMTCPHCKWDLAMLELGCFRCRMCGKTTPLDSQEVKKEVDKHNSVTL